MSTPTTKSRIDSDGLRYQTKVSGSPFHGFTHFNATTMSCYLCGTHRLRSAMKTRVLIGKTQLVCAPSCKAAREADAGSVAAPSA